MHEKNMHTVITNLFPGAGRAVLAYIGVDLFS